MSGYTSTTDATREQLIDALKERDERIAELEGTVEEQNYAINMRDWRFEALEAENKRLRAALEDIADSEFSSGGQLRQIAREALAAVQEEPK